MKVSRFFRNDREGGTEVGMKDLLITNIQRFSLHDGPGIRTTVFFKGCSLRCPWCSNPENISMVQQKYVKEGEVGTYGRYVSCDEIFDEIMKDKIFYGEFQKGTEYVGTPDRLEALPGGATFSGGEALLQINRMEPLLIRLKETGIHMATETCLYVDSDKLSIGLKYIDLFYVDIKIMDKTKSKEIISGDFHLYLQNIDKLFESNIPVVFRIPVIGGYTDSIENQERVISLLRQYRPVRVELIKGHNLGAAKYRSMNIAIPMHTEVSEVVLTDYKSRIEETGLEVQICKI